MSLICRNLLYKDFNFFLIVTVIMLIVNEMVMKSAIQEIKVDSIYLFLTVTWHLLKIYAWNVHKEMSPEYSPKPLCFALIKNYLSFFESIIPSHKAHIIKHFVFAIYSNRHYVSGRNIMLVKENSDIQCIRIKWKFSIMSHLQQVQQLNMFFFLICFPARDYINLQC